MSNQLHKEPNAVEEWRPVVGYEGLYEASSLGRIRRSARGASTRPGRLLKPTLMVGKKKPFIKYEYLSLVDRNGVAKKFRVHRLVLAAFKGPAPDGYFGCHNNGDSLDNRIVNLRWDSPQGNAADMKLHGTFRHNNAEKTHCKRNHEFSPENTKRTAGGGRICIECTRRRSRENARKYRARKKAANDAANSSAA